MRDAANSQGSGEREQKRLGKEGRVEALFPVCV